MLLNAYMLRDGMAELSLEGFFTDEPTKTWAASVRLFREGMELSGSDIVVADASDLPDAPSCQGHPTLVCRGKPAERYLRRPFNTLWCSEDVGMADLVGTTLAAYGRIQAWEERLQDLVDRKRRPKELGEASLEMLGNPIFMLSAGMRCIFDLRPEPDEHSSERYRAYYSEYPTREGEYLSQDEVSVLLARSAFLEAGDVRGPGLYEGDNPNFFGYESLFYNIGPEGNYAARVNIDDVIRPFREGDWGALSILGTYLGKSIAGSEMGAIRQDPHLERTLEALLSGKNPDEQDFSHALASLGWDAEDDLVCVAVRPEGEYDRSVLRSATALLARQLPTECIHVNDEAIFLVFDLAQAHVDRDQLIELVARVLQGKGWKAGVSIEFCDLRLLGCYGKQASTALGYAKPAEGGGEAPIVRYEDVNLSFMLGTISERTQPEMICPTGLMNLARHDVKKGTSYVRLLKSYLEHNMHLTETANSEFIHRNTLLYQLKRIREISGLDLDDPRVRLELLMVLNILEP